MHRLITAIAAGLLLIGASGCADGSDADTDRDPVVDPAGAACLVGDADCYETGADEPEADEPEPDEPLPDVVVDPAGAACLVGDTDCYETGAPGSVGPAVDQADAPVDPAGASCLVGDADCYETGAEGAVDPATGMCPPGVTDCIDTSSGTAGGARCLPGTVGCDDTPNP